MADPGSFLAYARRNWAELARLKAEYWAAWKRRHGARGGIRVADELRRQVLAMRPGWPTAAERREDLETHLRVAEALRRVAPRRG